MNKGIVVSGSAHLEAGAVAAGDGARAVNTTVAPASPQITELRTQLAELIAMMRNSTELRDADELVDTAEQANQELARQRPNKHLLAGLFAGLASGVSTVATLAEAAGKIQQQVSALF
ncbi:MAG TPA: hypothetical protein VIR27_21950 [Mycobacteriales bacterium]